MVSFLAVNPSTLVYEPTMEFSGTSMAEDFPGTTMGFSFTADTIGAVADPYEDSLSTECDYVKWQSSQTACQALNHLIMTSANEPRLKVRLKEDELGIGTDSRGAFRAFSFLIIILWI